MGVQDISPGEGDGAAAVQRSGARNRVLAQHGPEVDHPPRPQDDAQGGVERARVHEGPVLPWTVSQEGRQVSAGPAGGTPADAKGHGGDGQEGDQGDIRAGGSQREGVCALPAPVLPLSRALRQRGCGHRRADGASAPAG